MSRWVDVLNRLRRDAGPGSLVAAQSDAAAGVAALLRTHDVVNINGVAGSGKTYLGWALARATGASQAGSPAKLALLVPRARPRSHAHGVGPWMNADLTDVIIVDNCPETRLGARSVVDDARAHGFRRVVLLTRAAVPDQIVKVSLQLGDGDARAICMALAAHGWSPSMDRTGHFTLWGGIWGDDDTRDAPLVAGTVTDTTITHV